MFSTQSENCIPICQYVASLFAAELQEPKIGMWGKGLIGTFQLLSAASLIWDGLI